MTFKKVEDRPTPPEVYNWRVYACAAVAAAAAIMIGYDSAFIGTSISLPAFKTEFGLSQKSPTEFAFISSNIVSTYQGGCFFGALMGYPLGQLAGRKRGLLASALIFCVGSAIMLAASSKTGLGPIYAGRILAGLGIGAASNLTPLYISDIAPPAIRGRLVGMYEIGWQMGGVTGFWINYGITRHIPASHKQWFIPFAVQLVPGGLFAIGIPLVLKESPRWLYQRGRRDEALKNLCYLRNLTPSDAYIIEEVNMIDTQIDHDISAIGTSFWGPFRAVLFTPQLFKRLVIVTSLFIWQNGTGINAINYYSPTIFKSIGITGTSTGLFTTGIFGLIKMIGSTIWAFYLIDKVGRRTLLIIGSAGGCVGMYVIAGYIKIADPAHHPTTALPPGGIAAMAFFYLWTIFYTISWNGGPWVICAESFPGAVRVVAQMFAAASNWLWNFVISRATPTMFLTMGYGVYLFFASMMVLSIPYLVLLVPETRNIPLEEMDRLFAPGISCWSANSRIMAELQCERGTADQSPTYLHKPQAEVEHLEAGSKGEGSI